MRKSYALFAAVMLLVTPYVQAKSCTAISCNYIDTNAGFEQGFTYWTTGGASIVTEPCNGSNAAELQNTEYVQRDTFYVDNTYSSFKISFRAFLPGDTDNWYDELKVRVTNNSTGVYEQVSLHGSSYTSHCGLNVINLSNNYSNANVTVKFSSGTFSTHNWQIDDVSFFATF